jgi:hypothetical protein
MPRTIRGRRVPPLLCCALLVPILMGCGGSTASPPGDLSARQLVEISLASLHAQRSVHLTGEIVQKVERGRIDARYQGPDSDLVVDNGGRGKEHVRYVADVTYLSADETFWANYVPTTARNLADRWIRYPGNLFQTGPIDLSRRTWLDSEISAAHLEAGPVARADLGGRQVWKVAANGAALYVDRAPAHLPVRFEAAGGDQRFTVDFIEFGGAYDIAAPVGALDLTQFTGGQIPVATPS